LQFGDNHCIRVRNTHKKIFKQLLEIKKANGTEFVCKYNNQRQHYKNNQLKKRNLVFKKRSHKYNNNTLTSKAKGEREIVERGGRRD
jgi:hypothetical protein